MVENNNKISKNSSLEARMKHFSLLARLFVVVFLGSLLLVLGSLSLVSAGLLASVETKETPNYVTDLGAKEYPQIVVKDLFGIGKDLAIITLTKHDKTCGENCLSEFTIVTGQDGALIDDIKFYTLENDGIKYLNPKEENIREYYLSYWGNVLDNRGNVLREDWINYNIGEKLPSGSYDVQLLGKKRPSRSVDWIIKTQGKVISELATWGNITTGSQAEVILNSPINNSVQYSNEVIFNSSMNITNGALITKLSLYDNSTGTWKLNKSITRGNYSIIPSDIYLNVVSSFDEINDSSLDISKWDNQTSAAANLGGGSYSSGSVTENGENITLTANTPCGGGSGSHTTSVTTKNFFENGTLGIFYVPKISESAGYSTFSGTGTIYIGSQPIYTAVITDSGSRPDIYVQVYYNGTYWTRYKNGTANTTYTPWESSSGGEVKFEISTGCSGSYNSAATMDIAYSRYLFSGNNLMKNIIPVGSYKWNIEACDSDGICGFAVSNYTVSLDATPPTIDIIAPNQTFDYLKNGTLLNLSVTVTDTNLDDCWYAYNNTNYTFVCSSGVNVNSTITQNPSRFNVTVFANDSVGNINSATKSWSYQILENNQTYNVNAVETSTETFNISISYLNTLWNTITANLEYDGTNYSATQHGTGNTITFSKQLNIPSITSASENKTFFWYFTLTNSTGSFTYKSGSNVQNVSEINIHPCTGGEIAYINFTTRNAENPFGLLNATFKSSWLLKNTGGSGLTTNYSYEDITETNSTWRFCITPGVNYTISVDIEIDAEDYAKNFYYFPDANFTVNSTTNITLYLLNDTKATPTTLRTVDNAQTRLSGVLVYIDAYDIGTADYYNVGMAKTNNNGEDIVYLNWYDTLYRFRMYQNGINTYTSNDSKIFDTPKIFEIAEDLSFSFDKFRDFEYSLTFNNVSRIFTLTFVKPNSLVDQGCLKVIKREANNDTTICSTCVTSDSATINCDVSAYGNGTFIAAFYATGSFSLVNLLTENVGSTFAKQINDLLNKDDAAFYSIFMSLIVLAMFLITPVLGVIGIVLGLLAISALGFATISYTYFVGIVIIGVIIIWILKR